MGLFDAWHNPDGKDQFDHKRINCDPFPDHILIQNQDKLIFDPALQSLKAPQQILSEFLKEGVISRKRDLDPPYLLSHS